MSLARISQNLADVRGRMADAALRAGRRAEEVKLVAVTKYVGLDAIRAIVEAGCTDLGESRPQQLWDRAEGLADLPVRWHLIGHLQRNKVRRTLPLLTMIHSVDSDRLVAALDEAGGARPLPGDVTQGMASSAGETSPRIGDTTQRLPILLEVNISGEAAKHGFASDELEAFCPELAAYRNVEVRGLMCMAGMEGDLDDARREFAALRSLRDRLRSKCPAGVSLDELSMGMSGDYEVAIEEGATLVRVGSALFEGV
jgi:uncharacterized pyridoxal phosphate-containing UPF0001 family protein